MFPDIQQSLRHLVNFARMMRKSLPDGSTYEFSDEVYQLCRSGRPKPGQARASTRMSLSTRSSQGSSICGDLPMSMENRRGSIFTPNADLTSLFIPQGEDPEANFCETFLEALYDAQVIKDIEAEVEGLRSSVSLKDGFPMGVILQSFIADS